MKIFVVIADVELTQKPDWLDDFRRNYDKPYAYHITLKQPCFIEEDKIEDIKNKLNNLFLDDKFPTHSIALTFDQLNVSKDALGGICVMIDTSNGKEIADLQKKIVSTLLEFNHHYKPKYQNYEENFNPHITIGRDLTEDSYSEAAKQLEQNYACRGVINKIVLAVVDNWGPKESEDPNNQIIYNLPNH